MMRAGIRPGAMQRGLSAALLAAALAGPSAWAAQNELPLPARVERLEKLLAANGLVDLLKQVEQLQQEVRALRGEIENQAYTIDQLRTSQRDTYTDVDSRLARIEQGGAAAAPGVIPALAEPPLPTTLAPAGSTVAGPPSDQAIAVDVQTPVVPATAGAPAMLPPGTPAAPPPGDPLLAAQAPAALPPGVPAMPAAAVGAIDAQGPLIPPPAAAVAAAPTVDSPQSEAAYRDAFGLLKAGQYEGAIKAFSSYLQQFPASQYNDNAQYWIGEAYYVMNQYEPAIAEYQKVVTNYPQSQKQSHAMLKIAYSYDALGLKEQALTVLTQLKQRYPDSAAASLADERLQRMRAGAAP